MRHIPVNELMPHPDNAKIYGVEDVQDLADQISASGWVKPLIVTPNKTIISGHRRHKAAQLIGIELLPCEVEEFETTWEELERLLLENEYREKTHVQRLEEFEMWKVVEGERARGRQAALNGKTLLPENFPEAKKGDARDFAAQKTGIGTGRTAERGAKALQAAKALEQNGETTKAALVMAVINEGNFSGALATVENIEDGKITEDIAHEAVNSKKTGNGSVSKTLNRIVKSNEFSRRRDEFNSRPIIAESTHIGFHGDCIKVMSSENLEKCSLLLSDPPYAMDYKSGWNEWDKIGNDKRHETIEVLNKAFEQVKKHLLPDAHIYIFGNPNEIETIKPIFCKYFNLKNILIWDRQVIGMGDLKTYGRSYDVIYFGYNETWKELKGTRDRDVLSFQRVDPGSLIHPTEKPIPLLEYLIEKSTAAGEYIIDPFAGSFSTSRASMNLVRNSYGIELEEKYFPSFITKKVNHG